MTGLLAVEGELHGVEDAILCAKKVKRRLSLSFDAALLSAFVASPCKVKLKEQATFRTHTTTQLAVQDRSVCYSVELQCGIVGLLVGGLGFRVGACRVVWHDAAALRLWQQRKCRRARC